MRPHELVNVPPKPPFMTSIALPIFPESPFFLAYGPWMSSVDPLPAETLLNVNCPATEPSGIEVTRLGKRLYNDELRLVDENDSGRRRYEI